MQRKALIVASLLVSAFLFGSKAKAEQVYQQANDYIPLVALCFKYDGGTYQYGTATSTCNGGTPDPGVFIDTVFSQEIRIENGVYISAVSLWAESTESNGANRPATFTAYLANGSDKVATSTPISWTYTDDQEIKFSFASPYLVTASTPVDTVLFEFNRDDGFPLFDTGKMNLRLSPNKYPPIYINPSYYSGGYFSGLVTGAWYSDLVQFTEWRDLAITVYQSDPATDLTFTYPENNSTVNDLPLIVTGTCPEDLELQIYNGTTYASSTTAFGSSIVCQGDDTWSYTWNPEQGFWNMFASTTINGVQDHAGISFYYLAQSIPPDDLDLSGNPLDGTEGANLGYWGFLRDWAHNLLEFRPYSYFFDLQDAFTEAFDTPSSTLPLLEVEVSSSTVAFASTDIPFDITLTAIPTSTFTYIVSQDQWDASQTGMKIIITLPWVVWWLLRLKKFFGI